MVVKYYAPRIWTSSRAPARPCKSIPQPGTAAPLFGGGGLCASPAGEDEPGGPEVPTTTGAGPACFPGGGGERSRDDHHGGGEGLGLLALGFGGGGEEGVCSGGGDAFAGGGCAGGLMPAAPPDKSSMRNGVAPVGEPSGARSSAGGAPVEGRESVSGMEARVSTMAWIGEGGAPVAGVPPTAGGGGPEKNAWMPITSMSEAPFGNWHWMMPASENRRWRGRSSVRMSRRRRWVERAPPPRRLPAAVHCCSARLEELARTAAG